MPSIYLCNVTGDGLTRDTGYQPSIANSARWVCLMIHDAKGKAIVVAAEDNLSGSGITRLLTGTTLVDLRNKAKTTNPTNTQRTALSTWLANNNYQPLPAQATTWWDCIHWMARQVNPAADLDLTG